MVNYFNLNLLGLLYFCLSNSGPLVVVLYLFKGHISFRLDFGGFELPNLFSHSHWQVHFGANMHHPYLISKPSTDFIFANILYTTIVIFQRLGELDYSVNLSFLCLVVILCWLNQLSSEHCFNLFIHLSSCQFDCILSREHQLMHYFYSLEHWRDQDNQSRCFFILFYFDNLIFIYWHFCFWCFLNINFYYKELTHDFGTNLVGNRLQLNYL